MICVGEGEEALVDVCEYMIRGADVANLPNIWTQKGGQIKKNPMRSPVNINDLPFLDYDIFEVGRGYWFHAVGTPPDWEVIWDYP